MSADDNKRLPQRLPLLDAYLAGPMAGRTPFDGCSAVMIQHQLGSIVPMTAALIDLGLDPSRVHLIDIPYTANATVRAALEGLGIPGENFAPASYSLDQPY